MISQKPRAGVSDIFLANKFVSHSCVQLFFGEKKLPEPSCSNHYRLQHPSDSRALRVLHASRAFLGKSSSRFFLSCRLELASPPSLCLPFVFSNPHRRLSQRLLERVGATGSWKASEKAFNNLFRLEKSFFYYKFLLLHACLCPLSASALIKRQRTVGSPTWASAHKIHSTASGIAFPSQGSLRLSRSPPDGERKWSSS
jgi:hypothetical protein